MEELEVKFVVTGIKLNKPIYNLFGRPLILSDVVKRSSNYELKRKIDTNLGHGSDGFNYQLGTSSNKISFSDEMLLLDYIISSYSQVSFIHIELNATEFIEETLNLLQQYTFPRGCLIASKNPKILVEIYKLTYKSQLGLALIVETEKEFSGLDRCPYSAIEITNSLATHEQILRIHNSGKAVFVRAIFNDAINTKDSRRIEKRFSWLKHEKVDAIISNRTDLLKNVLDL